MCGIFGIIGQTPIKVDKLAEVSDVIRHRGPDDEGFLLISKNEYQEFSGKDTITEIQCPELSMSSDRKFNEAFLHRRLSIIDLSPGGHQPMSYWKNKLWITYNGEIYNYLELKEELTGHGYEFVSNSDTEVILAAYHMWGTDCVNRFNGMWAFAIRDLIKNQLFISRDRFGIKPLYYYHKNAEFIFCSEIKGIREYLEKNISINEKELHRFAIIGEVVVGETEETIFEDIKQLLPAHILIVKDNNLKLSRYWRLKLLNNNFTFSENVERYRELFHDAIKYRLRSDVEVGSCLSGGLDSSSIVSYGSSEFNKKFSTFSAIWTGEKVDESMYVSEVNEKWNCNGHAFVPDLKDLLNIIEKVIWHQENPLGASSYIAQWCVMEKAKNVGIKVLLDGQGADEILGGYPHYVPTYINEMLYKFKWKELFKNYVDLANGGYSLKTIARLQKNKVIKNYSSALPLSNNFLGKYNYKFKNKALHFNNLSAYLIDSLEKSSVPHLLHIEDRNSMAHSVEARVPYLDYKLAEFSVSIPSEQKIHGTLTKIIMREAMKNYIPEKVYKRTDKIGFSTPIEEKLFIPGSKIYNDVWDFVERSDLWQMNIIDKEKLKLENYKASGFRIYSLAKFIEMWS